MRLTAARLPRCPSHRQAATCHGGPCGRRHTPTRDTPWPPIVCHGGGWAAHASSSHRRAAVCHGEAYGTPPYTMASRRHTELYHDTACDGVAQKTTPKERGVSEQQKTRQRGAGTEETEAKILRAPSPWIVDPVEVKVTSTNLTVYKFCEK